MGKSRRLSVMALITNIAIVIVEVLGFAFLIANPSDIIGKFSVESLKYYTCLTALITLLASFLMIWANIVSIKKGRDVTPRFFFTLRFISAVMNALTFITVVAFLRQPLLDKIDILFDIKGGCLFQHFIAPILSMALFVLFEIQSKARFKKTFEPFLATLLYAIVIIIITFSVTASQGATAGAKFAPYYFFLFSQELIDAYVAEFGATNITLTGNIITAIGVLLISYAIAFVLWLLNRIFSAIFVGVEYKQTSKKKEVAKKENFKEYMKDKFSFANEEYTQLDHIYHVSYHDRKQKTWKVKSEGAGRALKVFKTQKEAIDFAEKEVKKHGGKVLVHSMGGAFRKNW